MRRLRHVFAERAHLKFRADIHIDIYTCTYVRQNSDILIRGIFFSSDMF